jgi:hypothetical protein
MISNLRPEGSVQEIEKNKGNCSPQRQQHLQNTAAGEQISECVSNGVHTTLPADSIAASPKDHASHETGCR